MTTARDQIKREELRAMMGDDPDAWLNARLAEAARLQDEDMADDALLCYDIVTDDVEGKPLREVMDRIERERATACPTE